MGKIFSIKLVVFCLGCALGLSLNLIYNYFSIKDHEGDYYELKNDYFISSVGFLKSGTIIHFDKPMPESFSRYILYLNIHDGEEMRKIDIGKEGMIIPYWLNSQDDSTNVE